MLQTQDVSDTLYEQGEAWTTVCLGCFNFRYLLKMVEPASTGDLTQAEQCLIPCVITSSSVGKRLNKNQSHRTRIWTLFPAVEKAVAKIPS